MEDIQKRVIHEVDNACAANVRQILDVYFSCVTHSTTPDELASQVQRTKKGIALALNSRTVLLDSLLAK